MTQKKSGGFNYRDSGNGRYITRRQAENRPVNTWERERKPPPSPSRKK